MWTRGYENIGKVNWHMSQRYLNFTLRKLVRLYPITKDNIEVFFFFSFLMEEIIRLLLIFKKFDLAVLRGHIGGMGS